MSQYTYAILGAGRQGTAAAYDLGKFGEAQKIILADVREETAAQAAERINQLIGREVAIAQQLDVSDRTALAKTLHGVDITLSAVPYYFNLDITKACLAAGSSLCDMGGHTGVVRQQLALDAEAKAAGISIVPDCGMGPGLNVTMGAFAKDLLDEPRAVHIFDGGLPQNPVPPWNYQATFHINGLTNEMDGQATFLRDGKLTPVDTLSEPEFIEFAPLGCLEADVTSGGLSTSPWTFEGQLQEFTNKTLRYPGHFEWLRAFKELGLFSEEAIQINENQVVPREVYHALLEPKISASEIRDICVIRVVGYGKKDGEEATVTIDLIDYCDEETGFTAMERLTGWHCAMMMGFQARGHVPAGGISMEVAVPAAEFMQAVRERGINFEVRYE
jgi:lysine 6-dehydrogenase